MGKAINWILREDIQEAAGSLQTATGLKAGAEAAIHAMRTIFEDPATEGVILVDASNAFNSLNRRVALHNIQISCPFSRILINTYRIPSRMIILGGVALQSTEGTTQGDNLAMPFYAISTVQIQHILRFSVSDVKQVWLADDTTGAGSLKSLKNWRTTIVNEGDRFGYYGNDKKSWLILKNETLLETANNLFTNTKINITTEGKSHLVKYVTERVDEWIDELRTLSTYAKSQPQAVYAAFCFGEQNNYNYSLRTIPGMNKLMKPVDEIIKNELLPSIIKESITDKEKELYSLRTTLGGLGITSFAEKAENDFENSLHITSPIVALIVTQEESLPDDCNVKQRINSTKQNKEKLLIEKGNKIEPELEQDMRQAVLQAKEKGASSWLTVISLHEHGFALNKAEFRDAFSIRCNKQLKGIPSTCPCGQKFDLDHAMNCKRGGFVIMRHNNVRDF